MEFLNVGSFHEGTYMLHMDMWNKKLRTKWNLITIYGDAHDEGRGEFLNERAPFCSSNKEPLLIGGDFNITRYTSEKNKNGNISRFSTMFNSIIDAHSLIEIDMTGGKYTWSNNQCNPTLVKLDRFLMSKQWEDIFPRVKVNKLPREVYDHNPLVLITDSGTSQTLEIEICCAG
jgi:endonuclease/exonuclease/phosphatase family metal-dependent hydrolase